MTRADEYELALASREQAEKLARGEAHARFLASARPMQPREPEKLDTLNAAFARLRSEARP